MMLDDASSEICVAGVKRTLHLLIEADISCINDTAEKILDKSRPILYGVRYR